MDEKTAKNIVLKSIADYNLIAHTFSSTRNYLSQDIIDFTEYLKSGDSVLDFGCGNGRLSRLFDENIQYIGIDSSKELISIAEKRYPHRSFKVINDIPLEFEDQVFDTVFALAVFHHIPSVELRKKYLSELYRVLKNGGLLVWTVWIPGCKTQTHDLFKKDHTMYDNGDFEVPFYDDKKNKLVDRYVHIFKTEEAKELISRSGFEIIDCYIGKRGENNNSNITIIAKKGE